MKKKAINFIALVTIIAKIISSNIKIKIKIYFIYLPLNN